MPVDGPGVARADEEVEAAEAELRRIEQLRRTTALTRRFLARAQEQAHQDMAPVLATTLRGWLPAVTRGRYVDATVDPETLAIQVYGSSGRWRPADRLSAGTTDQVYLLLRVALAQHLATTGETCPLLLDGVTAQSDDERTREILDLLLRLAAERQVVLFTQEETVLRWAAGAPGRRPPPRPRAHPPARRLIRPARFRGVRRGGARRDRRRPGAGGRRSARGPGAAPGRGPGCPSASRYSRRPSASRSVTYPAACSCSSSRSDQPLPAARHDLVVGPGQLGVGVVQIGQQPDEHLLPAQRHRLGQRRGG